MKRLIVLFGCVFLLFGGCQEPGRNKSGVEVIIEESREFPEVMVGAWEAEMGPSKWVIKFEPDGSMLEMTHFVAGEVDLREEGTYLEGPEPNTYAVFVMGPCETEYNEKKHELKVTIILDYYKMVLPQGGEVEGKVHDYIKGPISKDGKTWEAQWLNYVWMEGAAPPDPNLVEANPVPLVFTKVVNKEL